MEQRKGAGVISGRFLLSGHRRCTQKHWEDSIKYHMQWPYCHGYGTVENINQACTWERERDRGRRDRRKMALREERSGVRQRENNSVYSCMWVCVFARGSGHRHADSERAMFHANEENARVFFFFTSYAARICRKMWPSRLILFKPETQQGCWSFQSRVTLLSVTFLSTLQKAQVEDGCVWWSCGVFARCLQGLSWKKVYLNTPTEQNVK